MDSRKFYCCVTSAVQNISDPSMSDDDTNLDCRPSWSHMSDITAEQSDDDETKVIISSCGDF